MAEQWTVAFGRYLRTLRERQGLSLKEVVSLSQPFADPVDKGYLSRCENGHQRLAFSKAIPLCRIYKIPADALLERMELDMELDRRGGPETDSMSFDDLLKAGAEASARGEEWHAYAFTRDAAAVASVSPGAGSETIEERVARAQAKCAECAETLGKVKFARYELHGDTGSNDAAPAVTSLTGVDGGFLPTDLPPDEG